jgi:Ca2+-binding EF-hand superfamily protein
MASRKTTSRRTTTKKRAQRATSNVFAMFDQAQIQEFKEAFNMIDQNRDGFVDKEDLHDMLASLGKFCTWQQPVWNHSHLCASICGKENET